MKVKFALVSCMLILQSSASEPINTTYARLHNETMVPLDHKKSSKRKTNNRQQIEILSDSEVSTSVFAELPTEIFRKIADNLDIQTLSNLSLVNHHLSSLCKGTNGIINESLTTAAQRKLSPREVANLFGIKEQDIDNGFTRLILTGKNLDPKIAHLCGVNVDNTLDRLIKRKDKTELKTILTYLNTEATNGNIDAMEIIRELVLVHYAKYKLKIKYFEGAVAALTRKQGYTPISSWESEAERLCPNLNISALLATPEVFDKDKDSSISRVFMEGWPVIYSLCIDHLYQLHQSKVNGTKFHRENTALHVFWQLVKTKSREEYSAYLDQKMDDNPYVIKSADSVTNFNKTFIIGYNFSRFMRKIKLLG